MIILVYLIPFAMKWQISFKISRFVKRMPKMFLINFCEIIGFGATATAVTVDNMRCQIIR